MACGEEEDKGGRMMIRTEDDEEEEGEPSVCFQLLRQGGTPSGKRHPLLSFLG